MLSATETMCLRYGSTAAECGRSTSRILGFDRPQGPLHMSGKAGIRLQARRAGKTSGIRVDLQEDWNIK